MAKKQTAIADQKPAEAPKLPLRLEWMSPADLAENPMNWRTHPEAQIQALTDVISEVGWAGACLYNERTGRLIDGHARKKVAHSQGTEKVPVLVGNWDEATERKILATLDPLAAMAEADTQKLDELLRGIDTGSEALQEMLSELADDAGLYQDEPEIVEDEVPEPPKVPVTQPGDLWLLGVFWSCEKCSKEYSYEDGLKMGQECPCDKE